MAALNNSLIFDEFKCTIFRTNIKHYFAYFVYDYYVYVTFGSEMLYGDLYFTVINFV